MSDEPVRVLKPPDEPFTPAELLEIRARDQKIPLTPRQHVILLASTHRKHRYTLT